MDAKDLSQYVNLQLSNFFPDAINHAAELQKYVPKALERTNYSLSYVKLPGYTKFNYLHSDLYAQFLYFLSNTIWQECANKILASKLFYLNKALHAVNCMYDTELPQVFLLLHCVGSVIGKASYSNFTVICQGVTIGTDRGHSPIFNGPMYAGPGSSIVGKCNIGAYTTVSLGTTLLNYDTPENSLIYMDKQSIAVKPLKRNLIDEVYFNHKD